MPDRDGQQREALEQASMAWFHGHPAGEPLEEHMWRAGRKYEAALAAREEPTKAKVERVAIALAGKLHWLQDDGRALELAHCALAAAREDTERPDEGLREWTLTGTHDRGYPQPQTYGGRLKPGESVRVREIVRDTERPDPFDRCICGHDRGDHEQGSRGWCMRDHRCECEEFVRDTEQEPER